MQTKKSKIYFDEYQELVNCKIDTYVFILVADFLIRFNDVEVKTRNYINTLRISI